MVVLVICLAGRVVGQENLAGQENPAQPDQQSPAPAESFTRTNWLLYVYEKSPDYTFTRLLPLYSSTQSSSRLQDEFWFWPLLAGYEIGKNPAANTFPFGANRKWYTLPFLTLGHEEITPTEDVYTSTLVSFLFMSYFQERQVEEKYSSQSWYSLPVLSYYQRENLWDKDTEISSTVWGSPLVAWKDSLIVYRQQIFPHYQWAFNPLSLLLGQDFWQLMRHARWGRDHLFEILGMGSFSLFSIQSTFAHYPGSAYDRCLRFETQIAKGIEQLFAVPLAAPRSRLGILAPWIVFESSPSGYFSWQFLPLFHYVSQGQESQFFLLPLCLEFGTQGIRFSPQAKWFPLLYHDPLYGSWDILWPLLRYVNNPSFPESQLTMRLVFDYQTRQDSDNRIWRDFSILEKILFSYKETPQSVHWELLPGGVFLEYYRDSKQYEWRVLGFGYLETSDKEYLQLLFFKISLGNKKKG